MPEEGFKVTLVLIGGFVLMAFFGMIMMATGRSDVNSLLQFYVGLGALASMFGLPNAIQKWLDTRGQTSELEQKV